MDKLVYNCNGIGAKRLFVLWEVHMKNTGICPKCDSKSILRIPGNAGAYGSGNNIMTGITVLSAVKVTRYLCCECGYSEEWIDDKKDIKKLIDSYKEIY